MVSKALEAALQQIETERQRESEELDKLRALINKVAGLLEKRRRTDAVKVLSAACDHEHETLASCEITGTFAAAVGLEDELDAYDESIARERWHQIRQRQTEHMEPMALSRKR